jgi:hypothetical protein
VKSADTTRIASRPLDGLYDMLHRFKMSLPNNEGSLSIPGAATGMTTPI